MPRYFVKIAYQGGAYCGWQKQPHAPSIQDTLEQRISTLLRTPVSLVGAGRTDTGVHAEGMIAHFDTAEPLPETFVGKLNNFLPKDIAVLGFFLVRDDAHARFDALSRTYQYRLSTEKDVFAQESAYYYPHPPDIGLMNEAALILLEETHFQCFSKSNTDVKTDICHISHAYWQPDGPRLVFTITANRFLRNMVRAIVGTLLNVGRQKYPPAYLRAIIKSKDRSRAGLSVPAYGLYLTEIKYPQEVFL